ncbi:protein transport protein SEC61 subunit beta [Acrasis kona]|uniref:Protein transport protein SEC61 subunit beta n=1 Tax=Acrasis kona TaxID=1008807 RepID=A0AAW2YZ24_9EUKA
MIKTVKRKTGNSGSAQRVTVGGSDKGVLKTYFGDDEAPGIKVGPTFVLVGALVFIFVVIVMHFYSRFLG